MLLFQYIRDKINIRSLARTLYFFTESISLKDQLNVYVATDDVPICEVPPRRPAWQKGYMF